MGQDSSLWNSTFKGNIGYTLVYSHTVFLLAVYEVVVLWLYYLSTIAKPMSVLLDSWCLRRCALALTAGWPLMTWRWWTVRVTFPGCAPLKEIAVATAAPVGGSGSTEAVRAAPLSPDLKPTTLCRLIRVRQGSHPSPEILLHVGHC